MVNYGKISMESKKGTRFDLTSDTEPQMIFVPSQGNILVIYDQYKWKYSNLLY